LFFIFFLRIVVHCTVTESVIKGERIGYKPHPLFFEVYPAIGGGTGHESTADYYKMLTELCTEEHGTYPKLIVYSIDMNKMLGLVERGVPVEFRWLYHIGIIHLPEVLKLVELLQHLGRHGLLPAVRIELDALRQLVHHVDVLGRAGEYRIGPCQFLKMPHPHPSFHHGTLPHRADKHLAR